MRTARFVMFVVPLAVALAVVVYLPTFVHSWTSDDIDYINHAAGVFAGQSPLLTALFHPHAEHLVVGFQALFFTYLRFVGIDAVAWRVGIVIVHSLSAISLAILARRYAGVARAGFAAAVVYITTVGFTSMWTWHPCGAGVPLMMSMLTGSAALLAWRDHLRLRHVLAGAGVVAALLTDSAFAPMALLPVVIDEYERRREGKRGIGAFSVWTLAMIAGVAALVALLRQTEGSPLVIDLHRGLPRAAFLVLAVPFRFFFPGVSITAGTEGGTAIIACVLGITIGASVAALLVLLWRKGPPPLAIVAAISTVGPLGVIVLIGIGRWMTSYQEIYDTDRYFFPLLAPIALLAGAVIQSFSIEGWSRFSRTALLVSLAVAGLGELAIQRRALIRSFPISDFGRHGARYASLARLAAMLDRAGPIEIPRQYLWFSDVHNGRVRTAVLTEVLCRDCRQVHMGGPTVDEGTAARLNVVLDQWARNEGEPLPFLRVVEGRVVNTRLLWRINFSQGDFEGQGVRGFYEWRKPYRWMGKRGEVTLTTGVPDLTIVMAAPMSALRRRFGWRALSVRVTLIDAGTGQSFLLGVATVVEDGVHRYSLHTFPFRSILGTGRAARLVLECDHTWNEAQLGVSSDPRARSIQLFAVGSEGDRPPFIAGR